MIKDLAMIACVSQDLGLGRGNDLLWKIPADMQFFKSTTMGHPIIMGSKTYASIGCPLPGRENIVLSHHNPGPGVTWFSDRAELDAYLEATPGLKFIIGGGTLYSLYLPLAEHLYLTEVNASQPADVYFPKFEPTEFERNLLKVGAYDGIEYAMVQYTRKVPDAS